MNHPTPQATPTHSPGRADFLLGLGLFNQRGTRPHFGHDRTETSVYVYDDAASCSPDTVVKIALGQGSFSSHHHLSSEEARVLAQALTLAANRADHLVLQAAQQLVDAALMHHVELHEAPHTLAVIRPINRKRAAPLDVKLYALGRGVSVHAERSDLARREGAFELEANGKFFVFDPSQACVTQGFVSAIERDVAAISLKLQAKNIEDPTQGRAADGHWHCYQKTAIVSLPTAMGKTTMARALAKQLGLSIVVDDWSPDLTLMPGALHLTSAEVPA